jgi:tetratricopeptide (TPR) repeat protein
MRIIILFCTAISFLSASCRLADAGRVAEAKVTPCAVALTAPVGEGRLVAEITRLQQEARRAPNPAPALEKLGWRYVEKARLDYDPGYYKLAEQCALCLEAKAAAGQPRPSAALLLRGHALHNLHRFAEAEEVARELVSARGMPFDYGLLGDVLMERGRLDAAIEVYQRMINLRPGPQSYSRGRAHALAQG